MEENTEILAPLPHYLEGGEPVNKLSDEQREAIVAYVQAGGSLAETAREFGINRNTVSVITREHTAQNGEIENLRLGKKFHDLAEKVVDELTARDLVGVAPAQLGVLAGISVDKKLQLTGKPTPGSAGINLRIAWRDGAGAVELQTE